MKPTRMIAVAALIAASGLVLHVTQAQQPGIKRTDVHLNAIPDERDQYDGIGQYHRPIDARL